MHCDSGIMTPFTRTPGYKFFTLMGFAKFKCMPCPVNNLQEVVRKRACDKVEIIEIEFLGDTKKDMCI